MFAFCKLRHFAKILQPAVGRSANRPSKKQRPEVRTLLCSCERVLLKCDPQISITNPAAGDRRLIKADIYYRLSAGPRSDAGRPCC